jgi:hypothetical protein
MVVGTPSQQPPSGRGDPALPKAVGAQLSTVASVGRQAGGQPASRSMVDARASRSSGRAVAVRTGRWGRPGGRARRSTRRRAVTPGGFGRQGLGGPRSSRRRLRRCGRQGASGLGSCPGTSSSPRRAIRRRPGGRPRLGRVSKSVRAV